jgi:hypothetical protein
MWKKILVDIAIALLTKVGAWLYQQYQQAKKLGGIAKRIKKQSKKVEDAETTEDVRTAHRNHDRL